MFRSTNSMSHAHPFALLSLITALSAVVLLFSGCSPAPVPITGANAPVVDAANNAPAAPVESSEDLGAGYRLVTNQDGVRIVAPETIIRPADKTYDLGAGYRLVITATSGEIIPPARPVSNFQRVDLGAGYVLELSGDNGRIIPPASAVKEQPLNTAQHKEYIGGGFWLVTGPDGGQIVQEGSK